MKPRTLTAGLIGSSNKFGIPNCWTTCKDTEDNDNISFFPNRLKDWSSFWGSSMINHWWRNQESLEISCMPESLNLYQKGNSAFRLHQSDTYSPQQQHMVPRQCKNNTKDISYIILSHHKKNEVISLQAINRKLKRTTIYSVPKSRSICLFTVYKKSLRLLISLLTCEWWILKY